jgi:hypothetical protein
VFVIPFHIPNNPYFFEVNDKAGMTFDRTRLALIAEKYYESYAVECPELSRQASRIIELVVPGFLEKWVQPELVEEAVGSES